MNKENKKETNCCSNHHNCNNHNHHHHGHHHNHKLESVKNIKIAFLLNFFFSILEIIGGILTNSSVILSDAIHDLGDSLSLGLALIFEKKSNKEPNEEFPYGYKRLSIISAIINIIILSIGTFMVFKESIERLLSPEPIIATGMVGFAILGICINGISVFRMKKSIKISEKAVMLHLLEDLFGWIAVLIVSIVVMFTDLYILDPILSLVICIILVRNIYYNIVSIYKIIMQSTPENINLDFIKESIKDEFKNIEINSLKIWSLDGEDNVAIINITFTNKISLEEALKQKELIKTYAKTLNLNDITVEFNI